MSYGRQRFSLAHELYHLIFDETEGVSISSKSLETDNEKERIADRFASYFLAPYNALRNAVLKKKNGELTLKDVISLEQIFGVSHKAMLRRLVDDGFMKESDVEKMTGSVIAHAKRYGYSDKLYLPSDENLRKKTYGNYIVQAETLKNNGTISVRKYKELLIDAYRYDIVYGEDNGGKI